MPKSALERRLSSSQYAGHVDYQEAGKTIEKHNYQGAFFEKSKLEQGRIIADAIAQAPRNLVDTKYVDFETINTFFKETTGESVKSFEDILELSSKVEQNDAASNWLRRFGYNQATGIVKLASELETIKPEETEGVFIAYASLHGNTAQAAQYLAQKLEAKGVKLEIADLSRSDLAENIEGAFRYDRMVLAAPTYEGGLHPLMSDFLHHLKGKGFCNRKIALIENCTWAPMAAKTMKAELEQMKDITLYERVVTIRSAVTADTRQELDALAADLTA